jgi:hypothetical protein
VQLGSRQQHARGQPLPQEPLQRGGGAERLGHLSDCGAPPLSIAADRGGVHTEQSGADTAAAGAGHAGAGPRWGGGAAEGAARGGGGRGAGEGARDEGGGIGRVLEVAEQQLGTERGGRGEHRKGPGG